MIKCTNCPTTHPTSGAAETDAQAMEEAGWEFRADSGWWCKECK